MHLTAHWRYADSCDLNCGFCFGLPETGFKRDRVDERLIVDKLASAGFTHLVFTGGEPLTRKQDLLSLIEYATGRGLSCSLDTNGLGLDESTLTVLQKCDVLVGLPLYSGGSQPHDEMVSKEGHHDTVVSLLAKLRARSVRTRINTAVTARNLQDILSIGDIVRENAVLYWNLLKFRAYRRALHHRDEYRVSDEAFKAKVAEIRQRHPSINLVVRDGDDDRKCAYFFIRKDGTVVSPVEDGREEVLGDLVEESAADMLGRIDAGHNNRKTVIERLSYIGEI